MLANDIWEKFLSIIGCVATIGGSILVSASNAIDSVLHHIQKRGFTLPEEVTKMLYTQYKNLTVLVRKLWNNQIDFTSGVIAKLAAAKKFAIDVGIFTYERVLNQLLILTHV